MHRRSLLALLAVLPALSPRAFAQDNAAAAADAAAGAPRALTQEEVDLINAISAHNSAIKTMQGRFLQIDRQGSRIEGTFFLVRPNKIRFRYDPPSREEIVSSGRGFFILDRKEKTTSAYPQDKVPLRQFLSDNIDLLHAGLYSIEHSPNYVGLTLNDDTPKGPVSVDLIFDKDSKELVQWVLKSPDGAELTFSLFDVEHDVEIKNSNFYVDPTYTPR
ncbi:MAG TPA: outer membrane lipoprotein carrier protein LolA [Devosia sp.]|nr:outer membrane lipoprotein carrier protein LolA [Devosia sp.]